VRLASVLRSSSLAGPERFILAFAALYVLVLAGLPLGRLVLEALNTSAGRPFGLIQNVWASPATQRAFWNTLDVAAAATAISTLIGGAMALAVAATDIRLKPLLVFAFLLPLLIPPQISAMAWADLVGPGSPLLEAIGIHYPPGTRNPLYSAGGIAFVMGIEHASVVFLAVRAGLASLPADLIEAARLNGARPPRVLARIVLPLLVPSILSGTAIAFVAAIGNFAVPALLGIPGRYPTLTTLIYQRLSGFGPRVLGDVAALSIILIVLAVLGLIVRTLIGKLHGRMPIERGSRGFVPFRLKRARVAVEAAAWLAVGVLCLLPLLALVATSLIPALGVPLGLKTITLKSFHVALAESGATVRAFRNSLALACLTAAVSIAVAVPLAYLSVIRRSKLARLIDAFADAPYAIPGTVLSVAVILVFIKPLPILGFSIYSTFAILLVAYLARFMAFSLRPVAAAFQSLDPAIDEAGRMVGARAPRRIRSILFPAVAPAAGAGAILVFMTAFSELTVSALLWSTGNETVGVVIFSLYYEGESPAAAAVAVLAVGVTFSMALIASLLARRLPKGVLPWAA
jgi:iron(III) transport system permease protein